MITYEVVVNVRCRCKRSRWEILDHGWSRSMLLDSTSTAEKPYAHCVRSRCLRIDHCCEGEADVRGSTIAVTHSRDGDGDTEPMTSWALAKKPESVWTRRCATDPTSRSMTCLCKAAGSDARHAVHCSRRSES